MSQLLPSFKHPQTECVGCKKAGKPVLAGQRKIQRDVDIETENDGVRISTSSYAVDVISVAKKTRKALI